MSDGATVLSCLVLTPVIVNSLGNEQYGVWSIAAALITYLALLDFGLGPTVVRHGAEYRGRRAPEETNALVSAGLVVYGAVGAVTVGRTDEPRPGCAIARRWRP